MAKGYMIFTEEIHDLPAYANYVEKAVKTISDAGGRIIVVDDRTQVLEGRWHGSRTVIVEFNSPEVAKAWYNSPAYQAIIGERHLAAEANAVLVHGV